MKLFILVVCLAEIIDILVQADLMNEPPAIEFKVETNQPIGTLIGSIRDFSTNHMQPPYYVIPIQPDNQELFNRDILIDLDTGKISSNSILNSNRVNQYKFSVLSINEGLANLVLINVIEKHDLNETNENLTSITTTKIKIEENINRNIETDKCIELTSNRPVTINNNLKSIYDCFQINLESTNSHENLCSQNPQWIGIILIECNKESNANLMYLNRQTIESFEYDNLTLFGAKFNRNINEFYMKQINSNLQINFECARVKFTFDLNLLNQSNNQTLNSDLYNNDNLIDLNNYLKYNDQKNKSKIIILSYERNQSEILNCSRYRSDNISSLVDEILNTTVETTTLYNIIKIDLLNQNFKICLIILSVLVLSLSLLLYGLFIWYKQDNSSTHENPNRFTSSSNLTYKTQTSTMNSKYNEEETNEDSSHNYFSLIVSHFQRNTTKSANDLTQNTIKSFNSSQDNSNLLVSNTNRLNSEGMFSYSNGYLAEIGINMMDNLNCINKQTRSSLIDSNLASVSQFWSQDHSVSNTHAQPNLNDENFQKWFNLLGWKPEYNDISSVLNDLALLKDLSK